MSRGILQLEMEELQWNRKMLMDHMGYRNYRDINAFLDILITNKHVTCQKDGKIEWFRSSGPGNIWLNAKKEGNNKLMQATGEPAAGDNLYLLTALPVTGAVVSLWKRSIISSPGPS